MRTRSLSLASIALAFWHSAAFPSCADTCFEIFARHGATMQPLQCAENAYHANNDDFSVLIDLAEAGSGQFSAAHDGLTLFGGADPRPANLLEPFHADTGVATTSDATGVTEIRITHRGDASFMPRDIAFQTATFDTKSRVVFVPVKQGSPGAQVQVAIGVAGTFLLRDNAGGGSSGACIAVAEFEVLGGGPSFSGGTDFDLAINPSPTLFGDFNAGNATVSPAADGTHVALQHTASTNVTEGQTLALDSATNGSIFADGFESGDTSVWRAATAIPLVFTIRSPDPDVRFQVLPEPPDPGPRQVRIVDWRPLTRVGGTVTLAIAWDSRADERYRIEFSRDGRGEWMPLPGHDDVASQGAQTARTLTVDIGNEPDALVRVLEL